MLRTKQQQVILAALFYFIHIVNSNVADTEPKCKFTSRTLIDCSNTKVTAMPKIFENTTESLNMSLNSIQQIEDYEFSSFGGNLITLDLSSNQLTNVTEKSFFGLNALEVLILSSNKLTELDTHTFELMINLKRLDLRRNFIILPQSGFLIQHSLEELNLDNCHLEEIPDATFTAMPQLRNLTLSGNSFSENIDVSAFEMLKGLIMLRISNLSVETTHSICLKLDSIDTIQFDGFNISCIILSEDSNSFQDAILTEPIEEPRIDSVMSSPPITTRKQQITKAPSTSTHSSTQFSQELTTPSTNSSIVSFHENVNETFYESSTNKTRIDTETASIDIESETIKYILIGIFVTVTGIFLIGLLCRLDVCKVKTTLCRSKTKNRRGSIEAASPFEDIPLNTVNGTGKN